MLMLKYSYLWDDLKGGHVMYSVKMTKMVKEMGLTELTPEVDIQQRVITDVDVNRPALQLAGFYEYFDKGRVQIIGKVETATDLTAFRNWRLLKPIVLDSIYYPPTFNAECFRKIN